MPGVQVRAEHHHFVLEIAAGNFRDGVVSHEIGIVKLHLEIHGHLQVLAVLDDPHQPIVIFGGEGDLRRYGGSIRGPGPG